MTLSPNLDPRLNAAFDFFPRCRLAADIGADHGKLALSLVLRQKADRVAVTDISAASLRKAEALFAGHGASERALFLRGDGLTVLPSVPDALSICGMGGKTMSDILEKGMDRAFGARLILSPQTEIPLVRRTLYALGYHITDEKCVVASGRFYVVICSEPGKASLTDEECELGPCLIKQTGSGPVRDYYLWKIGVYSAARNEAARRRIQWIRDALGKHAAQREEAEESEGSPPAPCETP